MKHPTHEALRRLRLYGMARGLEDLERQPERSQLSFDDQLALLVERETAERANTALASRLKRARLRQTACLEDLDWRTPRGLDRTLVRDLASCRWVREHQPLLVTGPTGIGKTFVACALGNQAAREGYGVFYTRLTRLLDDLATARLDGSLARVLRRLARLEVLIIDDWAMTELTAAQRLDLMEVIDDRHDRAATVLATQIPVANWHRSIGDATYADAILDRVVHRALRIELTGESMRRVRAADQKSAEPSSSS
ncbi:MAG TPA: IS21-like element helper ATPase IstB [Caulobacteraceae bacterium]|jgi:DNA replication protein DnaC|nr:IS21-like element helper ATPase IstB [Caulobacteraceae bacterium]